MKFLLPILVLLLISCNKNEVNGIHINGAYTEFQSFSENNKLILLIEKTLNKDPKSLKELIEFDCGGASFCYDLGSVLTQIIYKIGEDDFIIMTNSLSERQKQTLCALIGVGLEYGFRVDSINENKTFEFQFPKLYKVLHSYCYQRTVCYL